MKFEVKIRAGKDLKLDSIIYCDPTEDKLNRVIREILHQIDELKKPND